MSCVLDHEVHFLDNILRIKSYTLRHLASFLIYSFEVNRPEPEYGNLSPSSSTIIMDGDLPSTIPVFIT
jgi:hypothetical protein